MIPLKQKVLINVNNEKVEKTIILRSEDAIQDLAAELLGELWYITEFETTEGDIISSAQIISKL